MKTRKRSRVLMPLFILALIFLPPAASAAPPDAEILTAKIDRIMAEIYKPGEPGASIIVRKNGKTIFRKGYGLADLELGVPVAPDMIFRVGSITKQFTAVAVLMLAEQGRLGLQDEITKYLPGYPSQGGKITIEHLLTHTSGIQSLTEMPEWLPLMRKDFSLMELIDLFKDKPMQFEPGENWAYNNSGYILLGAVIEKVSGKTYEAFLEERIFKRLGMAHSRYDHSDEIILRRARGYQMGGGAFMNAPYVSMTQPHAAGALLSSVDDLAVWNDALLSGKVIGRKWLSKAWSSFQLKNGESTGYGYGWFISDLQGHRTVEHGGGIQGFTSYVLGLPDDGYYLAILTNSSVAGRQPEPRAVKIALLALGLSEQGRKPVVLGARNLDPLVGLYENDRKLTLTITTESGRAYLQMQGGAKNELLAESPDEFFTAANPSRILAQRDATGSVTGLRILSRIGPAQVYTKTSGAVPASRKQVAVDPKIYDRYAGDYELAPGFIITILRRGNSLISRATGQPEVELYPESETRFFLKVVDGQVDFILDDTGNVSGLVVHQGGQDLPARKIRLH